MLTTPDHQGSARALMPERGFPTPDEGETLDISKILGMVARQLKWIVGLTLLSLVLGVAHLATSVPRYTASTAILIDSRKVGLAAQSGLEGSLMFETGAIDSQVQVLMSDKVAYGIVDKLKLHQNREFMTPPGSMFGSLAGAILRAMRPSSWFSQGGQPTLEDLMAATESNALMPDQALRQLAVEILKDDVSATRVGRTHVLNVAYTATNPELAARIANAFADQYLVDQLESRFDATRRASVWLEDRIDELRKKALEAATTVQQFKAKNNLIAASGRLVNEQQLSELNSQLIIARAETSRMRARFERIKEIVDQQTPFASVAESLASPVINDLRVRFLQASKTESEISARLGPNHVQAANLRKEMKQYERLMIEEFARLAENYDSEYQIARDRERALDEALKASVGTSVTNSEQLVKLGELERDSQTYQNLYQTYLSRFQEAMQQQSFPVTEARVITPALAPMKPSAPRGLVILAASLFIGFSLGCGVGLVNEWRDRSFRSADQVRSLLGLDLLGNLPMIARLDPIERPRSDPLGGEAGFRATDPALNHAVEHPLSEFSEVLRSVKVAIDFALGRRGAVVIGVVSMFPGEGKTTVAKNMASLFAMQGARVLLIDGDMRHPTMTQALTPDARMGLVDVLSGKEDYRELLRREDKSTLLFLPGATHQRIAHTSELIGSARMSALIEKAGANFDYIIIDLPPIGPVVDARAVSPLIDKFVYVIEWGKTPKEPSRARLSLETEITSKCIGAVMTKVQQAKMRHYDGYSGYVRANNVAGSYYVNGKEG